MIIMSSSVLLGVDSRLSPGAPNSRRSSCRMVSSLLVVLGLADLVPRLGVSEEAADDDDWSRDRSVNGESIPLSSLAFKFFK